VSLPVLDTSAIKAFAAGSIDAGEPILEVHSAGGRVVLPVVCLIEAARRVVLPVLCLIEAARQVGDDMPCLLVDHPTCEVAPLTEELWAAVTAGTRILGRLDLAVAPARRDDRKRVHADSGTQAYKSTHPSYPSLVPAITQMASTTRPGTRTHRMTTRPGSWPHSTALPTFR
jgi:hypothetical protein